MKNRSGRSFTVTALLALMLAALPATGYADGASWEQIRNESGILVMRKEVPGSPLVAFRGEGIIDAPVLLVGSVLVDTSRSTEWMDSLVESRILRKVSESEYVTYSHVATPIVMKDREFVTDTKLEVDAASKTLTISIHSVNDPAAPHTSYVRGELMNSMFKLISIEGGKKTKIVAEMHCDPKGNVADWIVNLFQKSWAYNTIRALRNQVNKPDIRVHARLKEELEKQGFFPSSN